MTTLSAQTIRMLSTPGEMDYTRRDDWAGCVTTPLVTPFAERTVHAETGTTYGLGPCGYDIRIREAVKIEAGRMKLASAIEHLHLPNHVEAVVYLKSTWARKGIVLPPTTIEPGWKGYLTLELLYFGAYSAIDLPAGTPLAEVRFRFLDEPTEQPYAGKYQGQPPIPTQAIFENAA